MFSLIAGLILIGISAFLIKYSQKFIKTEIEKAQVTAKNFSDIPVLGSFAILNSRIAKGGMPLMFKLLPIIFIFAGLLIILINLTG